MSKILFDLNNLVFRVVFVKDVGITTPEPDYQLFKYMVTNSIYESLYNVRNVNEIILAVDDRKSWRSLYFPRYKESRKKQRDKKTDVDWQTLFSTMESFFNEIKTHLPFKVIKVQNCEADDVIAVLCTDILDGQKHIISNDEDFLQLISPDITLYNPSKQTKVECSNTEKFLLEKCLLGQAKDDIFNIKTPNDWGQTSETEGKKKPGFGPAALRKVMEYGWEKWLKDNNLEENYKRNRVLMDFHMIPKAIRSNIRKAYETYELPNPENIYKFFNRNKFRSFLEDFTRVENKLLELY
jgi:hypothetical protein